jgi:hypothetical protein
MEHVRQAVDCSWAICEETHAESGLYSASSWDLAGTGSKRVGKLIDHLNQSKYWEMY